MKSLQIPGGARRGTQPRASDPCFLCEAIAGREDKGIVEETEQTVTMVNFKQFEIGQVLVCARRHAQTLFDLTDDEAMAVMQAARRVAQALVRAYDPEGMNLIQNNGIVAGQSAPHFHMHVVPVEKWAATGATALRISQSSKGRNRLIRRMT